MIRLGAVGDFLLIVLRSLLQASGGAHMIAILPLPLPIIPTRPIEWYVAAIGPSRGAPTGTVADVTEVNQRLVEISLLS